MGRKVTKKKSYTIKKQHYFSLLLIAALLLMFYGCSRKNKKPEPTPPRVTTTTIKQDNIPVYISAIGQVIPTVTVNIRPQVNGKLINVFILQGAIVNENDLLYEIDPRPYQALLDEAQAQLSHDQALLEYAEQTVARYKQVLEEDFISTLAYEQYLSNAAAAAAQVEQDKAAIYAAQINLDYCKILAPVSGKISYYNVDVGNIMVIDDPNQITVIRPFSPIDIEFSLPQQQFELIRRVQGNEGNWKFVATLEENPDRSFEGTTYFIDNQIDQNTGTILLKGRIENKDRELWPGQFIRVKVLHKMAPNALTVPPSSVLIGKDGPYIYTVDKDNKAIVHNVNVITKNEKYTAIEPASAQTSTSVLSSVVKVGIASTSQPSEVKTVTTPTKPPSPLNPGDVVIVDGQINVAPDLKVNPVSINKP